LRAILLYFDDELAARLKGFSQDPDKLVSLYREDIEADPLLNKIMDVEQIALELNEMAEMIYFTQQMHNHPAMQALTPNAQKQFKALLDEATNKKEEKVEQAEEPVLEPTPAETPTDESTTTETPEQDAALDITAEPVDKKAFYGEIRNWMGTDKVRAGKVLTVFKKHGIVGKISSDALTDDIITDLKTVMAGEE